MNPSDFQSGKTQAIDLDELKVNNANRPREHQARGEFDLDNWDANPWSEEARDPGRRGWAQDDRWAGDDEPKATPGAVKADPMWDVNDPSQGAGWNAPARAGVLQGTSEGWDDWGTNSGGGPLLDDGYNTTKEDGGFARQQAANQYASGKDNSNYNDGRAVRNDIYRSKEQVGGSDDGFGTAGLSERRSGFRAHEESMEEPQMPMDNNMVAQGGWGDEDPFSAAANASPASPAMGGMGDEIPSYIQASLVIFPQGGQPVVVPLKLAMTTIGRASDNTIVLNDPYASRKHAIISFSRDHFELMVARPDVKTSMNRCPVLHAVINHEDYIEIGQTVIRYVNGPVSSIHMQLTPPVNGEPQHIGNPPPSEKAGNKKLVRIILVSVITILVLAIVMIIVMIGSGDDEAKPVIAAADSEQPKEEPAKLDQPEEAEPKFELSDNDKSIAQSLVEIIDVVSKSKANIRSQSPVDKIEITVNTTPSGATIVNPDGSIRGTTPYKIMETVISDGNQKWTLKLAEYEDKVVDVSLADAIDINEELQALKPVKAAPKPTTTKTTTKSKPSSSSSKKTKGGGKKAGGRRPI